MSGLKILLLISIGVITCLVFTIIVISIKKSGNKEEKEKLIALNKGIGAEGYERIDNIRLYLTKNGVAENVGIKTPEQYYITKIILTTVGFIIGLIAFENVICIFTALIGLMSLNIIIKMCNDQNNESMVRDLKNIYDTLRIQTKAGVFLSEALKDCYLVVSNKRLKKAFYQLNKEIMLKHDIESAVEQLSMQFNNIYIDNFVLIIQQGAQTGQTVNMLDDISDQMRDAEHRIHTQEKRKLENKMGIIQILVLIGAIVMCLYGVFNELADQNMFNLFDI